MCLNRAQFCGSRRKVTDLYTVFYAHTNTQTEKAPEKGTALFPQICFPLVFSVNSQ